MVEFLGTPITTLRDECTRKNLSLTATDDADVLAALKTANAINKHTARVGLAPVFALSKVLSAIGVAEQAVLAMRSLVSARPPAGHTRGSHLSQTGDKAIEDLVEEPTGDAPGAALAVVAGVPDVDIDVPTMRGLGVAAAPPIDSPVARQPCRATALLQIGRAHV